MSLKKKKSGKFKRAKARHLLFTTGPNKISGGRLFKKHFDQSINLNEVTIKSARWPRAFDGLRIGHVSDFHLGDLLPIEKAISAVELLAKQEPDIVFCTGDVVDLCIGDAQHLFDALASINAPLGTMLVLGNHDELDCANTLSSMAIQSGITLLRDACCTVTRNSGSLNIAGIDWSKTMKQCNSKVSRTCNPSTHILLSHNPKAFHQAAAIGVPLTLSGHTHGGQVAIKNNNQTNLAITHKYSAGIYEENHSHLFVTVGVGSWFPLRINCPAEVALITMKGVQELSE